MSPAVPSVSVGHWGEQLPRRHWAKSLYAWIPVGLASSHVETHMPSPTWQFDWTHETICTQSVAQAVSAAQQSSPAADPVPATMQVVQACVELRRLVSAA